MIGNDIFSGAKLGNNALLCDIAYVVSVSFAGRANSSYRSSPITQAIVPKARLLEHIAQWH